MKGVIGEQAFGTLGVFFSMSRIDTPYDRDGIASQKRSGITEDLDSASSSCRTVENHWLMILFYQSRYRLY